MLRIFKGTGPGIILLIILILILLWISAFINPQVPLPSVYEQRPMPFYGILKHILGNSPLPGVIFSFAILSLMLFLVIHFNTVLFFINERTFLPAVIYLLFSALFPEYQVLNPVLPSVVFLMLALLRIMDSYRKQGIAYNFFDAGILIGLGSLFYANMVWFGLLSIIGIAIIRTGSIKEIGISILGLIAPYIILAGLYYILGKDLTFLLSDVKANLFGDNAGYVFSRLALITLIFTALSLSVSIVYLATGMNSKKIKARKTFSLLLWGFFLTLILYLVLPSASVEMIWIIGVPASYFLAHYFIFSRKKLIPEIIFSGFFLLILLIQVLYIF